MPVESQSGVIPVRESRVHTLDTMLDNVRTAQRQLEGVSSHLSQANRSLPSLASSYLVGRRLFEEKRIPFPPEFDTVETTLVSSHISHDELREYSQNGHKDDESIDRVVSLFRNPGTRDEPNDIAIMRSYAGPTRTYVHSHSRVNERKTLPTSWNEEVHAQLSDLQGKELRILELSLHERGILAPFKSAADRFYANGHTRPKTQIIPDSLHVPFTGPVYKVFQERGVLEQDLTRLGLKEGEKGQTRALEKVHDTYSQESINARRNIYGFVHEWLRAHPDIQITKEKVDTINEILDVIYDDTLQISESSLKWTALYALESVLVDDHEDRDPFIWTVSIGGDQVAPPYVESYITELLNKLAHLKQIKEEGRVSFIPELDIVATYHSQVRENRKDKAGNNIDVDLHVYNSRVTVERLQEFVQQFYPGLQEETHFIEFPDYDQTGSARLFYSILWKRIAREGPMTEDDLAKMFTIKGDVQGDHLEGQSDWGEDPVINFFREESVPDVNPYVIRHLISTMMYTKAHTLRWGAWRTEPQFHVVPMQAMSEVRRNPKEILQEFARDTEQFTETDGVKNIGDVIEQLEAVPDPRFIHAQNGMGVHASYYKHPDEPSIERVAFTGHYSADLLRQHDRQDKAEELESAFRKVTDSVGKTRYIAFLRELVASNRYAPYDADRLKLSAALEEQEHRMKDYLVSGEQARSLLGFYLS